MKRVGYLWEQFVSEENCIEAERIMSKNKPDNRMARYIGKQPDIFGATLSEKLRNGTFAFHEPRETDIKDSYKGKTRHLMIPVLEDQAAMQAWLNIATPHIVRRNYYYNCGSIPGAGQSRAVNGLKKAMRRKPRWGIVTDIRKFYETCPHSAVIRGLERIFKDKRFVAFANTIMENMSKTGVGLAIGYPVSHWFANVALMALDHEMRRDFPDVWFVRYMDDVPMVSRNKRHLRGAFRTYREELRRLGMSIKRNWQLFPLWARSIVFLSYRFFLGYTLMAKRLMFRIARKMKRAMSNLSVHTACGVMSYLGVLKHCDSQHFKTERVYPFVDPKYCRKVISNESKNILLHAA